MEEKKDWIEEGLEKVRQAIRLENEGLGYSSMKVSLILDLEEHETTIEVGKRTCKN